MSSPPRVVPARFRFGRDPESELVQPSLVHADELMLRRWYRHHDRKGYLTRSELALLAEDLSAHPELWRHLLRRSPDQRQYVQMFLDAHVEIWLICWCPPQGTGFHDHGGSRGAVAVAQGMLSETLPNIGGGHRRALYRRGDCFSFGASHIHDVQHAAGDPAASLHSYSPPLGEMGFYELDDGGTLTRRPGDSDEESADGPGQAARLASGSGADESPRALATVTSAITR
ncbi:MAG TPA: cysteine dioxygenase family protein [Gaiellales bacterium]|nr:cysteine dioxygenase family protein [Gaiellales bacterium]